MAVFDTELLGIQGVEAEPEVVVEAEKEAGNVAEKVASVVADAAGAAKTMIADTDDVVEGHEEL